MQSLFQQLYLMHQLILSWLLVIRSVLLVPSRFYKLTPSSAIIIIMLGMLDTSSTPLFELKSCRRVCLTVVKKVTG